MNPPESALHALRRTTEADLNFVMTIELPAADERLVDAWSHTEHLHAMTDPDQRHLLVESSGGQVVGFLLLAGASSRHRNIELKRIVIEPRKQGHGKQAIRLAKRYVFEELGAHRLWLDVKEFNHNAQALYRSEGFVEEGTLRECIKGPDKYDSLIVMSILDREYKPA